MSQWRVGLGHLGTWALVPRRSLGYNGVVIILDSVTVGLTSALVELCSVSSLSVICSIGSALANEIKFSLRGRESV